MHLGHKLLLSTAAFLSQKVIVGVTTEELLNDGCLQEIIEHEENINECKNEIYFIENRIFENFIWLYEKYVVGLHKN